MGLDGVMVVFGLGMFVWIIGAPFAAFIAARVKRSIMWRRLLVEAGLRSGPLAGVALAELVVSLAVFYGAATIHGAVGLVYPVLALALNALLLRGKEARHRPDRRGLLIRLSLVYPVILILWGGLAAGGSYLYFRLIAR